MGWNYCTLRLKHVCLFFSTSVFSTPRQPCTGKPLHEWQPISKPRPSDHTQILTAAQVHDSRRWWCHQVRAHQHSYNTYLCIKGMITCVRWVCKHLLGEVLCNKIKNLLKQIVSFLTWLHIQLFTCSRPFCFCPSVLFLGLFWSDPL